MKTSRRRMILDAHDMTYAPRHRQEAFWRRYNRRGRWGAAKLGDLASELVSDQSVRSACRLQEVVEAWRAVVPTDYDSVSRVEAFSRGRLLVVVANAATKYFLSRQVGEALITGLNGRLGGPVVKAIQYRVGSLTAQA